MSFFKNINATPRTGSVIMHPDGFSIYTENGWRNFAGLAEKDILVNARIVEQADGSCVDIDDIFGEHISDERVLYELILRSICHVPISQIIYSGEYGQIYTRVLQIFDEQLTLDRQKTHIRGWFSNHDVIRDIFEKYPDNIEFYMGLTITYLQKLKSEGVTYKYIDEKYMHSVMASYEVI